MFGVDWGNCQNSKHVKPTCKKSMVAVLRCAGPSQPHLQSGTTWNPQADTHWHASNQLSAGRRQKPNDRPSSHQMDRILSDISHLWWAGFFIESKSNGWCFHSATCFQPLGSRTPEWYTGWIPVSLDRLDRLDQDLETCCNNTARYKWPPQWLQCCHTNWCDEHPIQCHLCQ